MSSPGLKRHKFTVVQQSAPRKLAAEPGPSGGAVLRAIVLTTVLGAGIWFLLWKLAAHFWLRH